MRRAGAVARKQWRYLSRTNLLYLVFTQPLIFCLVWGYCASLDLRDAPLAVLDQSRSPESRALLRELDRSGSVRALPPARCSRMLEFLLMHEHGRHPPILDEPQPGR